MARGRLSKECSAAKVFAGNGRELAKRMVIFQSDCCAP
jgi:hypothetical protein